MIEPSLIILVVVQTVSLILLPIIVIIVICNTPEDDDSELSDRAPPQLSEDGSSRSSSSEGLLHLPYIYYKPQEGATGDEVREHGQNMGVYLAPASSRRPGHQPQSGAALSSPDACTTPPTPQ